MIMKIPNQPIVGHVGYAEGSRVSLDRVQPSIKNWNLGGGIDTEDLWENVKLHNMNLVDYDLQFHNMNLVCISADITLAICAEIHFISPVHMTTFKKLVNAILT